jgi:hypothetical protein
MGGRMTATAAALAAMLGLAAACWVVAVRATPSRHDKGDKQ